VNARDFLTGERLTTIFFFWVLDAMNISGSLSIKTATIGGKANGSYVDSDKLVLRVCIEYY
jgi:hypothetical protein